MKDLTALVDVASERLGGSAVCANDEFFAPRSRLVAAEPAVFSPERYTDRGKWMDGWETRRRRESGHDWCIVKLGAPAILHRAIVDTSHFKGNHPEACSIEACYLDGDPTAEQLAEASVEWAGILGRSSLSADSKNVFALDSTFCFTHVRLSIYPDGGVARLRVLGEPILRWGSVAACAESVELACADRGGVVVDCSDMFFASPHNVILPGPSRSMPDGWETRRRRGPGHDWVVVRLGAAGTVRRIEVDTSHFKGNAPGSCSLDVLRAEASVLVPPEEAEWAEILPRIPLLPHTLHAFDEELSDHAAATHVRLNIYPDGGVARLRVHGEVAAAEVRRLNLRWLDALPPPAARVELRSCCGSSRFARQMAEQRPFSREDVLLSAAERVWQELEPHDWLEAFDAHPRLGDTAAAKHATATSARLSVAEQSAANRAERAVLEELREANREYEERHGFVFLLCASGRSAEEILAALRSRIANTREAELANAAAEQQKITRLRLERLAST